MNDTEENLGEPLAEAAQGNEVKKINPWRDPISLVAWGFLMTSFALNFLLLQYILPTIGMILLYLGFRQMRKGNRWFYDAWILSGIRLLWQLVLLIVFATPINTLDKNNMVLGTITTIYQLILLGVFRAATRTMFYKEGIKPNRDPALGLIIWTILISFCALTSLANNWIVFLPLIVFYLSMIISIYRIGDEMGAVADAFIKAPVRVGSRVGAWGYLITCFVIVMICSAIANHIPPIASEQTTVTDSETRSKLLKLGFPKEISADITDADITLLRDAFHVEYFSEVLNYGQKDNSLNERLGVNCNSFTKNNLEATTVYVELPDNVLYVFVYFLWQDGTAYWQDGFTIWGEQNFELLDGVQLFHKNGTDYTAPISRLKCEAVATNNWFGSNASRQISGAVCYPYDSKSQRGYIFYRIPLPTERWYGANCFNYMHNTYPFQFPYQLTEKRIQRGIFHKNIIQHYTNFDMKAFRDANDS